MGIITENLKKILMMAASMSVVKAKQKEVLVEQTIKLRDGSRQVSSTLIGYLTFHFTSSLLI